MYNDHILAIGILLIVLYILAPLAYVYLIG